MSSFSQTSWFCSLHTTHTTFQPSNPKSIHFLSTNHRTSSFKSPKIPSFAVDNSKEESLPEPSSSNVPQGSQESKPDRIKLAFERAQKYKKSLVVNQVQQSSKDPIAESGGIVIGVNFGVSKDVPGENQSLPVNEDQQSSEDPIAESGGLVRGVNFEVSKDAPGGNESLPGDGDVGKVKIPEVVTVAMEMAGKYQNNKGLVNSDTGIVESKDLSEDKDDGKEEVPEAVRIAMEKAREYRKNKGKVDGDRSYKEKDQLCGDEVGGEAEVPEAVRIAMGKASEYKKNKGVLGSSMEKLNLTGLMGEGANNSRNETIEKNTNKKEGLKVSSIDFVGLSFADKKSSRGLPAGLVPVVDPFPEGDLQEVEIIVGDASKFGNATSSETEKNLEEESSDLYKPKVSTWGLFPRPSNISETFGGGRTIRPGEVLESTEDRAAKEARTRQLLAAYKRKMGLNMDPKLKAECEKALNDGDSLMDGGRLNEALPYYQKVMDNLPFQTELHGLAALQWSICQDSLSRTEEARIMYEKLQSHPNGQVNKKARQFMFSFQAMEMMKVTQSTVSSTNTDYGSYFEAFVEDKGNYTSGSTDVKEDGFSQALPYIIFLASPILLVLLVAARKGM